MPRVDSSSLWRERMSAFASSGLSQRKWCEREGIGLSKFSYWRHQLERQAPPQSPRQEQPDREQWCAITLAPGRTVPNETVQRETAKRRSGSSGSSGSGSSGSGVSILIGQACIEVQAGFDTETLRAVIQALEPRAQESHTLDLSPCGGQSYGGQSC